MKHKTLKTGIVSISLFFVGIVVIQAQEAVVPTGGEATGSGGTVSYTVGQVAYQTTTGTNYSIAEGVQQPYEISVVTAIENIAIISLKVTAYPNPVVDNLTLSVSQSDVSGMSYLLYNIAGRLLEKKDIGAAETGISMSNLTPSTYFVKVIRNNEAIKTFKIVKK